MSNVNYILLIQKYLENRITSEELQALEDWLTTEENKVIFKKMTQEHYLLKTKNKEFNAKESVQKALALLSDTPASKVIRLSPLYKYAAAAVLLIGLFMGYQYATGLDGSFPSSEKTADKQIKLILEDGQEQIVTTSTIDTVIGGNRTLGYINNGKLKYVASDEEIPLRYNILQVPYGAHFQVVLSDGTLVDMNAGSSLRYPASFLKNGNREVFLKGEAFFEVAKDKKRPFIVNVNNLNIEVLGTRFNVSAYEEDAMIQTTLEEGAVKVYEESLEDKASLLKPQEQLSYDKKGKAIKKQIVKVEQFTAWRTNHLIFKDALFSEIIKKLERAYDVEIINENKVLDKERFTARFNQEEIARIMTYFSKSYGFEFSIDQKRIIIIR